MAKDLADRPNAMGQALGPSLRSGRQIIWRRLKPVGLALIVPLLLLVFWHVATTLKWTMLIPTPYQVAEYMVDFAKGGIYDDAYSATLLTHLLASMSRVYGGFALLTSRCSFELVQKCAIAGIGALATVSAPTALALSLARRAHLKLAALAGRGCHYGARPPHAAASGRQAGGVDDGRDRACGGDAPRAG